MSKIYTIVLNSTLGTNQAYIDNAGTSTTDIRNVGFYYDWSLLPNKKYKINFSFITSSHTSTGSNVCNVYCDMAQLDTRFGNPPYTAVSNRLNYCYLGSLKFSLIGASSYLYADNNTNGNIYLNGRPTNNNFTISLINNDLNKTAYSSTTLFSNYTLTLTLEELE